MPDIGTKVPEPSAISLREMVRSAPYFVPLALLVLLSTTGAALIDYVFQSQAAAAYTSSGNLLRFFAVFNAAVGLATFLLQSTASQYVFSKIGLGKTLATLPVTTALSSFAAMAVPGLPATGLAKAAEQVFSRSFFRAGYELFYAPVPAHQKRAARPIIDVGFDRLGDGLGFGLVQVVLMVLPASASQAILSAAVIVGIVGFWIALRLDAAYIGVLESSLLQRADEVKQGQFSGNILSSATMIRLPVSELQSALAESGYLSPEIPSARTGILDDLTSGDLPRIQRALRSSHEIPRLATPVLIDLLTNDAVYSEVTRVLRKSAAENVGQLIDRLVDQDGNWKLRLRIPKVLSHCPLQRAADGLLLGLEDRDFQVRMRCGQALAAISSANTSIRISPDAVFSAVQREAGLEECAIEDLDPLDPAPEDDRSPMASTLPRKVNDSYLEYLFILLSLVLPRAPLRVAYHGLYTDDVLLRGTALEYLESMLPPDVREAIWPYLGEMRKPPARSGAKPSIADELLQSEAAIQLNLQHRYGSKPTG
jgi:hypothetical protein